MVRFVLSWMFSLPGRNRKEAAVSIMSVKVLFRLRDRAGNRQLSLTQPRTVSAIPNAVLEGLYPEKAR